MFVWRFSDLLTDIREAVFIVRCKTEKFINAFVWNQTHSVPLPARALEYSHIINGYIVFTTTYLLETE